MRGAATEPPLPYPNLNWLKKLIAYLRPQTTVITVLRARGASRDLVRFAASHDNIEDAFNECPRASWTLEFASRAGVSSRLITHALTHMIDNSFLKRDLANVPDDLDLRATFVESLVYDAVEAAPKVRHAKTQLNNDHPLTYAALSQRYDEVYLAEHIRLSDVVREIIPADAVRIAIEGLRAHPYR